MPSVNRFVRNGGRSQTNRYPQKIAFHLACSSADIGKFDVFRTAGLSNQVTFRRLSAVDRYIIALRRCYRSMPHAGLMLCASFFCGVDYDGLLFLFCMRLLNLQLCAFCVWTYGFASLYVSKFLTAACGVSLLRERPALSKAKGLDPNAFYFGCGSGGAVHLNIKSKRRTA